ncbi:hypothetical protein PCK1_000715 [Pneumocystis canis]|nr:hypothetical protein PCK1_000715 [Pneumocystis canis]
MAEALKLLEGLDPKSRDELSQFIEQENGRAKIQQGILEFTDRCFKRCTIGKLGNHLDRHEETCLQNCVDRWLDRKGVGLGAFENQKTFLEHYQALDQDLMKTHFNHLYTQLLELKSLLKEWARQYGPDIHAQPSFKNEFSQMCKAIGIDPLASTGSKKSIFSSDGFGIRDFYFVIELCRQTRHDNGGLIPLQDALTCINERRQQSGGMPVSEEDILHSIKTMDILSSGLNVLLH